MRIMFVAPGFMEKGKPAAGMSNYIYRVARAFVRYGHEVIIVAGGYPSDKHVLMDQIEVYEVATSYHSLTSTVWDEYLLKPFSREKKIQKIVHRICKNEKIDIIQYAGNTGNGMLHNVKVPAVMRMSSYFRFTYSSYLTYSKLQVEIYSALERMAAKRMNSVYAPSHVLADAFSEDLGKKVLVLETPYFNDTATEDTSVYDTILDGKKYILYYGRIEPDKGVYLIAEITKKILDKYKAYYLVFIGRDCTIGEQSTLGTVKKTIGRNDRVLYLNELTHEKLYPVIRGASLILMPSYRENLSNACMEAMDMQKVVVAAKGASYEQLINHENSGFLFKAGDSHDLERSIEDALSLNEEQKKRIGINAKYRIQQLNPEKKVQQLIRYYEHVIEQYQIKGGNTK